MKVPENIIFLKSVGLLVHAQLVDYLLGSNYERSLMRGEV